MNLNIIRYINGKEIDEQDLKKYEIDNEVILRTIKTVNERVNSDFRQETFISDGS